MWKAGVLPPPQTSSDEPVQDLCPEGCTCGPGVPHLRKGVWRKTSHSGSTHSRPLPAQASVPSALQVLCVFMKLRAQLQRWPPLVLLHNCEQVPKRRHSLMSGDYTGGSWRDALWLGFLPQAPWVLPSYPGIPAGLARCGSPSGRHSRQLSRCARSVPHPHRCWRWWRSW